MDVPPIHYTAAGDGRIAYQVVGEGPDLVYFSGMLSNLDVRWEEPTLARFQRHLAGFARLIMFDRRGSGLSDGLPPGQRPTWESFVDDLLAVLDAIGSERAFLFAALDAGPTAILFAASHPARASGLVLANTSARLLLAPDYPAGLTPDVGEAMLRAVEEQWGTDEFAAMAVPSRHQDQAFVKWYAKFQRASTKPSDAGAWLRGVLDVDVRDACRSIRVPTLVLHAKGYPLVPVDQGRHLAETIEGARFVELAGNDGVAWTENEDLVLDEVERLVAGTRSFPGRDRLLATVLLADIVGSTERAAELGDRRWADVLRAHEGTAREVVASFQGRFIKSTGDGFLATFDAPSRAIQCAAQFRERVRGLGLAVRVGLHTGEIESLGEDIGGIGVHIAARVLDDASPDEILATRTVKDIVVGSEISFVDRGARRFKGIPDEWAVFSAVV